MNKIRIALILTALFGVLWAFPNLLVPGWDFFIGVGVAGVALSGLLLTEWVDR